MQKELPKYTIQVHQIRNNYDLYALSNCGEHLGIIKTELVQLQHKFMMLNRIVVEWDYRGMGIGHSLIKELTNLSINLDAESINGFISTPTLVRENPLHFLEYLEKQGFTIDEDRFFMVLH